MLDKSSLTKSLRQADPAHKVATDPTSSTTRDRFKSALFQEAADRRNERGVGNQQRSRKTRARRWLAACLAVTLTAGSGAAVVSARSLGFFGAHSSQDGDIWCIDGNGATIVDFVSSDPIKDCERPRDRSEYAILSNGSQVVVVLKEDLPKNNGKTVTIHDDEILRGTWKFATAAEVVPPVNKREFFFTLRTEHVTQPQTCVTLGQRKEWLTKLAERLEVNPPAVTRGIPKMSFWNNPEYAVYAWAEGRPSGDDCTYLTYSARTHTVFVRKTEETPTVYPDSPAYNAFLQTIDSAVNKCLSLAEVKAVVNKARMAKVVDLDTRDVHYVQSPHIQYIESPHGECTRLTYEVGGMMSLKFWGPGPVGD